MTAWAVLSATSSSVSTQSLAAVCIALAAAWGLATLVFDRWLSIRPSLKTLDAYVESLLLGSDDHGSSVSHRAHCQLCKLHDRIHNWGRHLKPIMTDDVLGAWRQAHAVEVELARQMQPVEAVRSRLLVERSQLRLPDNRHLFETIGRQLHDKSPSLDALRSSLAESLRLNFNDRDTTFESLADLQTKSAWIALGGIALAIGLGAGCGRYELLLFGAVGGLLSRSARLLTGTRTATDYGVSGSSLVLAPISGALAGFAGVLLLQGLHSLGVLGHEFADIWSNLVPLSLALAVVLGFSERIFGKLISQTETAIVGK